MKSSVSSRHLLFPWYLTCCAMVLSIPCTTDDIPAQKTCAATCTQPGLGCEVIADPACTKAHHEISPSDVHPPSAPRSLNISTHQRDGHLWLRISWQLSVDASVQVVNSTLVQMVREDLTSTCAVLHFEHPIRSQNSTSDGKPWSFMYECFSVNVGETVTVNVYNMPHGNGALHTLYTAPGIPFTLLEINESIYGCNNAEVQGLSECTGQNAIRVNVDTGRENTLRVSYSSSIRYTEYTVVICSLFLVCRPLHRQVYAVEMHDCRVRTCPFREDPIKPSITLKKDRDSLKVSIRMLPAGCSFSLELTLLTGDNMGKSRVLSKALIYHRHQENLKHTFNNLLLEERVHCVRVVADNYLLNETMCISSTTAGPAAVFGTVVILIFILSALFLMLVCWKRRKLHSPPKGVFILYIPDSEPFRTLVLAFSTFLRDSYGLHVTLDLWCSKEIASLGPSVWLQKQLECFRSDFSTLVILPSPATRFKRDNSVKQLVPLVPPPCLTPESGDLFWEAVASLRPTEFRQCVVATFSKVTNTKDVPSCLKVCRRFHWPGEATLLERQLGVQKQSHSGSARKILKSVLIEAQKWRQDFENKKCVSKKLLKSEDKATAEQMTMMSEKTEETTLQTKLSSSRDSAFFSLEV